MRGVLFKYRRSKAENFRGDILTGSEGGILELCSKLPKLMTHWALWVCHPLDTSLLYPILYSGLCIFRKISIESRRLDTFMDFHGWLHWYQVSHFFSLFSVLSFCFCACLFLFVFFDLLFSFVLFLILFMFVYFLFLFLFCLLLFFVLLVIIFCLFFCLFCLFVLHVCLSFF